MEGALCGRGLVPPMKQQSFIFHYFLNNRKKEYWKLHAKFQGTSRQQQLHWQSQASEACETLINTPDFKLFPSPEMQVLQCYFLFLLGKRSWKIQCIIFPVKHDEVQFPSFQFESKSFSTVTLGRQFTTIWTSKIIFRILETSPKNLMDSLLSQNGVIWCSGSVVLRMYLTLGSHRLPCSANHSYPRMVLSSVITIFCGIKCRPF